MSKSMYQTDSTWYDKSIYNAIMSLDSKYPNAIPVFGGALHASKYVNCDSPNFAQFVSFLPDLIHSVKFYKWHESAVQALRRFCHLCYVDPALVELYIGMSFAELVGGDK